MDERQTLLILGWIIGGIVGLTFLLDAIGLVGTPT
jgi:hypothetical protein